MDGPIMDDVSCQCLLLLLTDSSSFFCFWSSRVCLKLLLCGGTRQGLNTSPACSDLSPFQSFLLIEYFFEKITLAGCCVPNLEGCPNNRQSFLSMSVLTSIAIQQLKIVWDSAFFKCHLGSNDICKTSLK